MRQAPGQRDPLRPLRFLGAGGVSTLAHWAVMAVLVYVGTMPLVATVVGAAVGAATNYGLQYHVTFRSDRAHRHALPRYLLVCGVGWLANALLFAGLYNGLNLSVAAAQVLTTMAVAVLSYGLYKQLVFHPRWSPSDRE